MKKWKIVKMEKFFCPEVIKKGFKTKKEAEEYLGKYIKENNPRYIVKVDYEYSPDCFGSEIQWNVDTCESRCVFCEECYRQVLKKR